MQRAVRTGGEIVAEMLTAAGVDTVFGVLSVHNIPIYDALDRIGGFHVVSARGEQGAASMADGYSRASGRLGVVITSTGVGAANAAGPDRLPALLHGEPPTVLPLRRSCGPAPSAARHHAGQRGAREADSALTVGRRPQVVAV